MKKILTALFLFLGCLADEPISFKPVQKEGEICIITCNHCAIQINTEFERLKSVFKNEDAYYDAMDERVEYWHTAITHLERYKILISKIIESDECPYFKFGNYGLVFPEGAYLTFILYEKGKKPHTIENVTSPTDEINAYFGIKNSQTLKNDQTPQSKGEKK